MTAIALLLLLSTSCAPLTLPPAPLYGPDAVTEQTLTRLQHDQARRRQQLSFWRISGILDLETSQMERRNRVVLTGEGDQRARFVLYGPFRQVARDLLLTPDYLRMIQPERREWVEVPATAEGLAAITGILLAPQQLLRIMLALVELPVQIDGNYRVIGAGGEQLQFQPETGRLLQRRGGTGDGRYQVDYHWHAERDHPERIELTWGERQRLVWIVEEWQLLPVSAFVPGAIPAGFQRSAPLTSP
ncbi:MAG: hypothetical protein HQL58_07640 [Magnetococcales bacterium]|nr:hypothetical protein [Magnetococcales bacterium]